MVTTEHLAKRRRRKRVKYRDPSPPPVRNRARSAALPSEACKSICSDRPQPLARLVEARHRLTGPPRKSQQLTNPPGQRRLEYSKEIRGHSHRTTCGPGEGTPQTSLGARGF